MSLSVYIGHTGQRLFLDDTAVYADDKALRLWIAQQTGVLKENLILLTGRGKQVKAQNLATDDEIFVFDAGRLSAKSAGAEPTSPTPTDFHPGTAPDAIANQNDLQAWQNLFRLRKSWASGLLNGCESRAKQVERYQDEQAIIERSLGVAVVSLQQHVKSAEQKYLAAETWAEELLQEQDAHIGNWEQHLDDLRAVPARVEFGRFIQGATPASRRTSLQGNMTTLQGFVDSTAMAKAAGVTRSIMQGLADRVGNMRNELDTIQKDSGELLQAVEQIGGRSPAHSSQEPSQLFEEIKLVATRMASDFEHVQSLSRNAQSISSASKLALQATRNHIPTLGEYCTEMNDLVQRSKQQKDTAAETAMEHMRTLSRVETRLKDLVDDAKNLGVSEDDQQVFSTVAVISRLPSVYGQLLVESVRRREWAAKMRRDSATLQEEVATYQEEEDKRRKKWVRSVEDVADVGALQSNVLGIELSLQNEGGSWPTVTREELQEYLNSVLRVYGPGEVTEELNQAVKDLDKPTRKQIKHARAFKNGSMHEAAFGDTSLLLRGDEQHKVLRESNGRLEEDLRAQKSRQRRLSSTAQALEDKKLARRVVDLEAELQAHRDEAATRKNSDAETQKQVEEAISTKKDLMENMEAQQREFASERRILERELGEAKERVEELENDMDRLMGSRDDERSGIDVKLAALQAEVARLKEDASGHAASAATEQAARNALERQLASVESARAAAVEEARQMRIEKQKQQDDHAEQLQLLAAAHSHLVSSGPPEGLAALAAALEELARKSAAHVKDLADAVAFAKSENESLWTSNERQAIELAKVAEKQNESDEHVRRTQESLAAEQAKAHSLEQQLRDEQDQIRTLREKFAEGETGSEVLRQRVAEEEARAGKLASELAEAKSHVNSLDIELMRMQKKHKAYHTSAEAAVERLHKRAERAKELSQRLWSQNARLRRLVEQFGLALSYSEDGAMIIERASKMAASTTIADTTLPSGPGDFSRTVSLTSPPPTRKSSGADHTELPDIHWTDAQSPEDESARFEAFLAAISRFNLDYFCDQIHKRLRDYEYTAKKYAKESKESTKRADAYKERSLKLKSESHAKIAVRDFKEGDLALFLPTRGQAKGAWAAFNVGCPHYFLAEREGMRLGSRDFIVARIQRVEQKVVDLSRSNTTAATTDGGSSITSMDNNDNPFDLSDGLTWWMVHAIEERTMGGSSAGIAPSTPGLGKSTVAAANVDAKGSIRIKRSSKGEDASKVLGKSLDSRRSSSNSKKGVVGALVPTIAGGGGSPVVGDVAVRSRSESQASLRPPPGAGVGGGGLGVIEDNIHDDAQPPAEQVRHDLLWGP
ncbi:hypothetical protein BAUCODRAFT_77275 [Baudoinia panamericana UAMH 10762]|uniref:Autophagy-related protein 11 n=1 Tax=Baudoinia panamericana (strain UAMH 10762) TaxID=717646 RepID=M2N207_BAUPA|nr:uncharacterized protein BAUCODRAFT_77275 [Baudoinia panamericana UAMH 10762]EMC92705.1 hypothetical protein BAUCODRAFT_77275 [Baudoinia panamericana UAMH 10762]